MENKTLIDAPESVNNAFNELLNKMYISNVRNVGMLIALVVGIRYTSSMYFEAALLIALFGFVSSAAMAKFLLRGEVIE